MKFSTLSLLSAVALLVAAAIGAQDWDLNAEFEWDQPDMTNVNGWWLSIEDSAGRVDSTQHDTLYAKIELIPGHYRAWVKSYYDSLNISGPSDTISFVHPLRKPVDFRYKTAIIEADTVRLIPDENTVEVR